MARAALNRAFAAVRKRTAFVTDWQSIREIEKASAAVGSRHCPNDGRKIAKSGKCSKCSFRIVVVEARPYDRRASFHRRPTKKSYASRPVPT